MQHLNLRYNADPAWHREQLRSGSRGRRHALPQQKSGTQLGAALLVIFRSMPFL